MALLLLSSILLVAVLPDGAGAPLRAFRAAFSSSSLRISRTLYWDWRNSWTEGTVTSSSSVFVLVGGVSVDWVGEGGFED